MKQTILYVDDQPSHRALFLKAFQSRYHVLTAPSGEEGVEIVKKTKIALVIADHNMPGMTGIDFLEKVQKMNPNAQKAILSAYLDDGILNDLDRRVQVMGRLAKPWKLDGMRGFIERAISEFELSEEEVAEEGDVSEMPSFPHREERPDTPSGDLADDQPLLTSREIAQVAGPLAAETPDGRGARRIFLCFVEPRLKSVFPLIRRPCDPLLQEAQGDALRGDVDALEKTLGRYLKESVFSAAPTDPANPVKKVVH